VLFVVVPTVVVPVGVGVGEGGGLGHCGVVHGDGGREFFVNLQIEREGESVS
jgi:hypothetical protein